MAIVETMMGRRPLHQLRPFLDSSAFGTLARHTDSGLFRRIAIGNCRTQMPVYNAVEASVELNCGGRWVTCVVRLDARGQRWTCTQFAVLTPMALSAA